MLALLFFVALADAQVATSDEANNPLTALGKFFGGIGRAMNPASQAQYDYKQSC